MAKKITDNVVNMPKRGRGRPKKNPEAVSDVRAPALGHNQPDAGVFLRHVQAIRRQSEEVDKAKLVVKTERGKLKDVRMLAQQEGLVMREVDEAIEALNTERVDLIAREQRRRQYMEWLGLPLGTQAELELEMAKPDEQREKDDWFRRGEQSGKLAGARKPPEGCPPEHVQDYLRGYDAGQEIVMRSSPVTAAAFDQMDAMPKDQVRPESPGDALTPEKVEAAVEAIEAAPLAPQPTTPLLVLHEHHFDAGIELDNANMKTLLPEHLAAFSAAERVVAVFGVKKRILREPSDEFEGGFYEDTGEPDAPLSEVEDVEEEAPAVEQAEAPPPAEAPAPSAEELA